MANRDDDDHDWEEEAGDWRADDVWSETMACPFCQREIHEEAQRCPHCERYLSEEDAPPQRKPKWFIVGVLLCLYAVYRWIAG